VLHAVQVSDAGTDIDRVVIGPAGVFTLNTKCHPEGKVVVYDRAIYVNGSKIDYLQRSQAEARLASELLTTACGRPVRVRGAVVFVDLADLNEKGRPASVLTTTRLHVVNLLTQLPLTLDPDDVQTIWNLAGNGRTWLPVA
jgi:hypothetical protein